MKKNVLFSIAGLLVALLAACTSTNAPTSTNTSQPEPTIFPLSETQPAPIVLEWVSIHTTQNDLSGNRSVNGAMDLANAAMLDIPLDGKPIWLVSAPINIDVIFVAANGNGKVQAFKISGQTYTPFDLVPNQLPSGMPPVLVTSNNTIQLIAPSDDMSPLTSPIMVENKIAYIGTNGDLVLQDATSQARLPINALTDSRILIDENNRLLILTRPTNRYDHGVLGDDLEASGITLIETSPTLRVIQDIPIDAPDVIEGLSPIWADIDNDSVRDIIVTLSNNQSGARIVVFHEDGTLLAESLPIGLGHRWRHQIALAQFAPNTSPLLVDIRTPHIGGIVEFFQLNDGKLDIIQEIRGISTHSIGSRNLDSAIAGDFNNDGIIELLAPDQGHTNLNIVSFNGNIIPLPLNGVLTSNLSATSLDGKIYVGAGTQDNLRIWIP